MVVTIKDLAKKLHVSPATVSLALNDNPAITPVDWPGAAAAPSPWCFRTWKTSTLPR